MSKKILITLGETEYAANDKIKLKANPKRVNSQAHARYEKYQDAKTVGEYFELNEAKYAKADFKYDLAKGFITLSNK